jgi:hypothetical protein
MVIDPSPSTKPAR